MSRSAVATENGTPPSSPDGEAWLDGLAGRDGASESARDGARLRAALKPADGEAAKHNAPSWERIVLAAKEPEVPAPVRNDREAANNGQWRRFAGGGFVVLALLLGAGLWTMTSPNIDMPGDLPGGLRGAPSAAGAVWRTENPAQAAKELAARMQAAGAHVTLTPQGQGTLVTVECAASACAGVAEQLAPLEMAVDANGRLTLQVLPLR